MILTALLVLMSMFCLRCSRTLSRCPALAARRKEVFPSDCNEIKKCKFLNKKANHSSLHYRVLRSEHLK